MPYTAEIRRNNPTCFLFLVDQSSSMLEPSGGNKERNKAEGVADAINRLLQNLALKCAKSDGIRDYFHVGVIGYGGNKAAPAFRELSPPAASLPSAQSPGTLCGSSSEPASWKTDQAG